jgi:putative DNA primase/helicase
MIERAQWFAATRKIQAHSYLMLGKEDALEDLADRLTMISACELDPDDSTRGTRRVLEHLRSWQVPDENWAEMVALHALNLGLTFEPEVLLNMTRKKMERGRPATDLGLAERIVDTFASDLAYCKTLGGWIGWDGKRWKVGEGDIMAQRYAVRTVKRLEAEIPAAAADEEAEKRIKAARKFAMDAQRGSTIASAANLARSQGLTVDPETFDARPELFTVGNGTIELGTKAVLREHRRADRLTRTAAAGYDPDARSEVWDDFVEHALPDEAVRTHVQKLVGYSLYGANDERLLIFLLGKSSTGKSTFVETIGSVLGDHAADFRLSLFAGKQEDAPRPDLIDALPKRFLHASEASSRWKLHADEIKTLTGHDSQRARGMRSDVFLVRKPAFTPWIATNAAPTIEGADQALWRRLVVIPFDNAVSQNDEHAGLSDTLARHHAAAVLAWAVAGWDLFQAEGLKEVPPAIAQASMQLRDSLSTLGGWLAEETEQAAEYTAPVDELWAAYHRWCVDGAINAADMGNKLAFAQRLTALGFGVRREGPREKRYRVRTGIRLMVSETAGGRGVDG